MLTLRSKLIMQLQLVLCVITLFSTILPSTTSIIYATSPPQTTAQTHQVFLPLVSNGENAGDIGGDGFIQAASIAANQGLYTTDKIIVIGSNRAINRCLNNSANSLVSDKNLLPNPTVIRLQRKQRIKIYSINPDPAQRLSISQQIERLNECPGVTAEPNYIYKLGIDPWGIGGSNIAMKDAGEDVGGDKVRDYFENQHIFTNILDVDMDLAMTIRPINQPIIGIFDTKPTQIPAEFNIQWNRDFMSTDDGSMPCENPELIKEHGMNVVSLANAVSFQNDVYLYRALNNCGQGDLNTLLLSLENFMTTTARAAGQGQPRIVNMSLSARPVPAIYARNENGTPHSLDLLLEKMKNADIVMVASAGNTSNSRRVEEPHWPASSPHVLAVAASKESWGRACYSNSGDIAAPGGYLSLLDIVGNASPSQSAAACKPRMDLCNLYTTDKCILAETSTGRFNYVKGTSFASPLVAGIIARNLATQSYDNVQQIYNCVKGGAKEVRNNDALGAGIITKNFRCLLSPVNSTP